MRGWGRRGVGRAVVFFRAHPREPVRKSPIRESPLQDSSARARPREPLRESPSGWVAGGSRVSRKARPRELVRESPIRESLSARAPPGESRVGRGWVAGEREPLRESPSARAPPGGSRVGRRGARTRRTTRTTTTTTTFPHCTAPYQRAQGFLTPFGHSLTLII